MNSLKGFHAATTNFRAFLAEHSQWTLKIEKASGTITTQSGEELIEALRDLDRGTHRVTLYVGEIKHGVADITRLITGKLKEEVATRACVGIVQYYNDALWQQGMGRESEASHESL